MVALREIRARAEWQIRRAVLGVIAGLLLCVGAGFLVAAIWMVIAAEFSPLIATLACAALFLGSGLVLLLMRSRPYVPTPPPRAQPQDAKTRASAASAHAGGALKEYPALMEAFLFGLSTYERVRKEREQK